MQTKKSNLEIFFLLTKGTEGVLGLAESRIRDKFMKTLTEVTKQFEEDRKVVYEKFCAKNEDGTPKIDNNNYHFAPDVIEDTNKELNVLLDETVTLEIPEGLKGFLERSEYKPKVGESEQIDAILGAI